LKCQFSFNRCSVRHCLANVSLFVGRHGFLALQGLEIPLMVLQTKVFLIVVLQNYTPFLSTKRTFIRRVQSAIHKQFNRKVDNQSKSSNLCERSFDMECGHGGGYSAPPSPPSTPKRGGSINRECNDSLSGTKDDEPEESLAMKLFTGIPFPEPRRVINIRPRDKLTTPTTSPRK
jgi:hypothetical protein